MLNLYKKLKSSGLPRFSTLRIVVALIERSKKGWPRKWKF